jgi:DNA-binding NtrC family response regulator
VPPGGRRADRSAVAPLARILEASLRGGGEESGLGSEIREEGARSDREVNWNGLEREAIALLGRGEEGVAASHFRRLALRGESARARAAGLRGLAEISLRRGRVAAAVGLLRGALGLHGSEPRSRVLLAVALGLLPDEDACIREWEALEGSARRDPGVAREAREVLADHLPFGRWRARSPTLRRRLARAAPSLFPRVAEPGFESASQFGEARLARAADELGRLARTTRSAARWIGLALPRIARVCGFPRASVRRQSEGEDATLFAWGDAREGGAGRRAREVFPLPGCPGCALILDSPHAWSLGVEERRFLERAVELLADRMRRPAENDGESGDWAELKIRLRARSVGLFERAREEGPPVLVSRGGAAAVPLPEEDDPALATALAGEVVCSPRLLAVPVPWEGRSLGALVVRSRRPDLGPREARRAEAFGRALATRRTRERFLEFAARRWRLQLRVPVADDADASFVRPLVRASRGDATILLHGESGCGKEIWARFAHFESARRDHPFVVFDAGSLPDALAEAELFGVAGGSFTGARARTGLLESAHRGTLLLDGVDGLAPAIQAKLLRALEARAVRRIGEDRPRPADVRVLSTMRGDPAEEVRAGRLRLDLFHRIGAVVLRVAPLRERRAEIPVLARALLERLARKHGLPPPPIESDAIALLWRQSWSGNVRELENVLCKALVLRPGVPLDAAALRSAAIRFGFALVEALPTRGPRAGAEVEAALRTAQFERRARIGRAAQLLGWHPDTVSRAIRRFGVGRE